MLLAPQITWDAELSTVNMSCNKFLVLEIWVGLLYGVLSSIQPIMFIFLFYFFKFKNMIVFEFKITSYQLVNIFDN